MLIAGVPIAPAFAASYGLVDALAQPGTTTEAFALLGTAVVAGVSLGTSFSGVRGRAGRPDGCTRAGCSLHRRGAADVRGDRPQADARDSRRDTVTRMSRRFVVTGASGKVGG